MAVEKSQRSHLELLLAMTSSKSLVEKLFMAGKFSAKVVVPARLC
jgi:hypothetical protein